MLGRKLEVISRYDGGNPGDAVRVAEELVTREGVTALAGTFLSNVGLSVTEFAGKNKVGKLNTDDHPDVATRYGISAIPAVMIFKGSDQPGAKTVGNQPLANLVQMVNRVLES